MTVAPSRPLPFAVMALLGFAVFGYATGVLMAPWAPVIGERLAELTCFQLAFTAERALALLGSFSAEERAAIAALLVPGDLVFALGYGLLLSGLLGLLTLRLPPNWQRWGRLLTWAPLGASLLDCIEDLFLWQMAIAPLEADPGLAPRLAGIAAVLKYLLLSALAPAYGIAGSIRGLGIDRRPGAIFIYLLVVANAVAFVARPLQQIPACF